MNVSSSPDRCGTSRLQLELQLATAPRICNNLEVVNVDDGELAKRRHPYYAVAFASTLAGASAFALVLEGHLFGPQGQRRSGKGLATGTGGSGWGDEAIVTAVEHDGGDARQRRLCLDKEIAVNLLVRAPPANEADVIGVNATTQHGHGTARASRTGGNVARREVGESRRRDTHDAEMNKAAY